MTLVVGMYSFRSDRWQVEPHCMLDFFFKPFYFLIRIDYLYMKQNDVPFILIYLYIHSFLYKDRLETNVPLKRPLYNHSWPFFFAICVCIFHKTEFLTVILRCFMGLNLNWYKCYDTKP